MPDEFSELPTRLLLYEEGFRQQRKLDMRPMDAGPDNEQWLHIAWQIQSRAGQIFFRHRDQTMIEKWLAEHDYVDAGDGAHYQKKINRKIKKKKDA